ncbi:unnamed protein product, partial [Medioppia subpectinata]
MRREYSFEGRSVLSCEAQSNPSVINFTWYKGNRTVSEVASSMTGPDGHEIVDPTTPSASLLGSKQSTVLVLADNDVEAYYCVATNDIGSSHPCKLHVQQIASAPSGWVQTLLADENLLIVAASAGAVVFLLASSVVVIVVCAARRRRLKGHLNPHGLNGLNGGHRPLDGSNGGLNGGLAAGFNGPMVSTQAFQRFSGTTNSTISSVHSRDGGGGSGRQKSASFALINQLPILDERS